MKPPRPSSRHCAIALAGLWISTLATTSLAQAWPQKAVRIIVPFPAGGSADSLARVISPSLTKRWGQALVIEGKAVPARHWSVLLYSRFLNSLDYRNRTVSITGPRVGNCRPRR